MFITRNNTIVIYLITTIAITIKYYKKWNILITLLLIPLVFNCLLNTFLDKKYGVEHYFQESVSIPLQQISSTVHIDGNLNKNEKEYINSLLELDIMRENYHPGLIDTIKWNTNFNRDYLQKTKMKFLRTWGSIMIKNFDTYIESHMLQTYCFWTLNSKAYVPNMYHKSSRNDYKMPYINQIKEYYNFSYINLLPQKIQKPLEKFYQKYVSLISEGLCFWLFIFSMLVLSYKRRNVLLIGIPLFSLWLSIMLATPISGSLRYVFPFFIVLPILIGYILNVKIDDSRR